ncbi:SusF/SusE family outer membrane protein [Alkaliflexus imshenetskii]|uniref:SusF/SusE family outer membrane protein n=1 Tax=Alkaliflexus imshenetskii TaxID=286730 RepID=UPI00047E6AD8|nr:SusF/SusE family outer membrane protein [Alkaliflexus imshenetskii]
MKNIKFLLIAILGLFIFASCEDEVKIVLDLDEAIPAELVSPASDDDFELLAANASELIVFDFDLAELSASVAVDYRVELSASSSDFSAARVLPGTLSRANGTFSVTVLELNKALLALGYEPMAEAAAYVRVVTSVNDTNIRLYSDVVRIYVTPYKIASDGTTDDGTRIYMVGAAVPSGWSAGDGIEMVNIAPDTYRATTTFTNERFRFFGQLDWGPISWNFPFFTSVPLDYFENARQPDREDGDENFWFKGEPGEYVITVNIETKTITIAPAPSDGTVDDGTRIYIVGAAVPAVGWSAGDAQELKNIAPGVYRATVDFVNDRFRFLKQQDWGDGYNFPFFTGYVNSNLENARQADREDGDENLWFRGTPGTYVVTVDVNKKTIELDLPYSDDGTNVYLVGAAIVSVGWSAGDALPMKNIAPNRYRATTEFAIDRFRFLKQQDWGDGYNFPYFTTVPALYLENALQPDREDGDENLWFKGPAGTYTITIDVAEKWITMY